MSRNHSAPEDIPLRDDSILPKYRIKSVTKRVRFTVEEYDIITDIISDSIVFCEQNVNRLRLPEEREKVKRRIAKLYGLEKKMMEAKI